MKGLRSASLWGLCAVGTVVVALATPPSVPGAGAAPSASGLASMNIRVCATPALGSAACDAIRHLGPANAPNGHGHGGGPGATTITPVSYGASQLQAAYGLTSAAAADGAGTTVAIVDAYDDPNASSDLATYRSAEGLGPMATCGVSGTSLTDSSTSPCFAKVNQSGNTGGYPAGNTGWAQEISVDLDAVSAICPRCNILLVEANSAQLSDLGAAVNTAASFGPVAIGNSYGGNEYSTETSDQTAYYDHPGIAITVATGDNGYGVEFPAAASSVIAVGGTSLLQSSGGTWSQTVWSGTGSGCSAYVSKPLWQKDTGCAMRTVGDVAADSDPNTGLNVYDTYNESGWLVFGGTSVSAQIINGVYGLAGGLPSTTTAASGLYDGTVTSALTDVTSGSNGSCTGHGHFTDPSLAYLCTGVPGYDGPTGNGTPNGIVGF